MSTCIHPTNSSPNFGSLEKMELNVIYYTIHFNPQKIFKFLQFVNTKLPNLKFLKLNFVEHRPYSIYDINQGSFSILPAFITEFINYKDELFFYDGNTKVKLNHIIVFNICSSPKAACEDYIEKLKKELGDFEYSPSIRNQWNYYDFERCSKLKENFELNIGIKLFGRLM